MLILSAFSLFVVVFGGGSERLTPIYRVGTYQTKMECEEAAMSIPPTSQPKTNPQIMMVGWCVTSSPPQSGAGTAEPHR